MSRSGRTDNRLRLLATLALAGWAGAVLAAAQPSAPAAERAGADQRARQAPVAAAPVGAAAVAGGRSPSDAALWPDVSGGGVTWFAIVVILLLTLKFRPPLGWRNADGLVLAAMCVLLALRWRTVLLPTEAGGELWRWWCYLALSLAAVYWCFRGWHLACARLARSGAGNLSPAAMLVLLVAGLALGAAQILRAPLSAGSRDGMVGAAQVVGGGKLPYGDAPGHDSRSPLLYLVQAAALELAGSGQAASDGARAARAVNLVLWLLTLGGLYLIGRRLHSAEMALAMIVIFCVFPGALECLAQPETMLAAALLTWGLAFALLPGAGGLLSSLCLVFAGLAWPWAWLTLPVVLAYFLRRGWQAVGSTVGLLGGAAICIAGLTRLTAPTIPRPDGALAAAGLAARYTARLTAERTLVIDAAAAPAGARPRALTAPLWKFLVRSEDLALSHDLAPAGIRNVNWPNGVDGGAVKYRSLAASGPARAALQQSYRRALAASPARTRALAALRSVLEATWLSEFRTGAPLQGAWQFWAGTATGWAGQWTLIRRVAKLAAGMVGLLLAAVFLAGQRRQPYQLFGAVLSVCSAALLASRAGAVSNLAWLMPMVLSLFAAHGRQRSPKVVAATGPTTVPGPGTDFGPPPRISVED